MWVIPLFERLGGACGSGETIPCQQATVYDAFAVAADLLSN